MFKAMPKTASSRDIQKNYRGLFDEVIKTQEPLFVLNNNKPEVVVVSLTKFEELCKSQEEYELDMAKRAIEAHKADKAAGKLKKLSSLADLE